ncbi:MAG: hypothetical protein K6A31_07660, partial [Fibrobacter sp.]|nr:hypothetical protein [Fibrobacter sp.]
MQNGVFYRIEACNKPYISKQNEKMFLEIYNFGVRVVKIYPMGRMSVMVRTKKISWGPCFLAILLSCVWAHAADVRPFVFDNVTDDA